MEHPLRIEGKYVQEFFDKIGFSTDDLESCLISHDGGEPFVEITVHLRNEEGRKFVAGKGAATRTLRLPCDWPQA